MFDDPRKNLKRIQEELWAAEYEEAPQEEETDFLEDVFSFEDSSWLQETRAELEDQEEPPIRNFANGYGRRQEEPRDFGRTLYADEGVDEDAAVFVEKRKKKEKGEKKRKKRGGGCLSVLIFLELLGIAGIAWWWYRWLT